MVSQEENFFTLGFLVEIGFIFEIKLSGDMFSNMDKIRVEGIL